MTDREAAFNAYAATLGPLTELERDLAQATFNAGWNAHAE